MSKSADRLYRRRKAQVAYRDSKGDLHTGRLLFFSKSTVAPEFDLAYIDFGKYWKVAMKDELIYEIDKHKEWSQ